MERHGRIYQSRKTLYLGGSMGKLFEKEVAYLPYTVEEALSKDVSVLTSFFRHAYNMNLLVIGSGGSYSAAIAIAYLAQKAGYGAKAVTPLELRDNLFEIHRSAVVLVTAGGRNTDTRNSYQYVAGMEPKEMLTICAKLDAPIKKDQKKNLHNYFFEFDLSFGKDGYLAVNSLIAIITLVAKSLYGITENSFFRVNGLGNKISLTKEGEEIATVLERETVVVLHAGIVGPVARDMESKFSEAALGNIQLADYRNFAHGRHYWLEKRKETTAVVMFASVKEQKLVESINNLLPADVPRLLLQTNDNSINGMLELYCKMFLLVEQAGIIKGINPGKPSVAQFGRKMYHLNYNLCQEEEYRQISKNVLERAVLRKYGCVNESLKARYLQYAEMIKEQQEKACFRGVIFDYDGTLHDKRQYDEAEETIWQNIEELIDNGVIVGIATGRGKSVRQELAQKISKDNLSYIWIAYYNGAVIGKADEDGLPDNSGKCPQVYESMKELLLNRFSLVPKDIEVRPYQMTVLAEEMQGSINEILEALGQYAGYKIVNSSHSIDIIPCETGKKNLIKKWIEQEMITSEKEILCIGDSGEKDGNDYELLAGWNGISVDRVSDSAGACWNWAPMGMRNLEATRYYLRCFHVKKQGAFRVKWGKK